MTTSTQPFFIRTGNGVVNANRVTTLTNDGEFTLLLDKQCNKLMLEKSENAGELFERYRKVIKPHEHYGLVLDNCVFRFT